MKEDLLLATKNFDETRHISIGKSIFKVRIASTDMNKGKAGGFRSYMYMYRQKNMLVPLCIYAKANTSTISQIELKYHLDETTKELL